jgi:hypothetical protein
LATNELFTANLVLSGWLSQAGSVRLADTSLTTNKLAIASLSINKLANGSLANASLARNRLTLKSPRIGCGAG